jgi:HK97 family phage portal protein
MAWYDKILGRSAEDADMVYEKLNPVQHYLQEVNSSREDHFSYEKYYEELEIVNRGVNMIVDDVAEIPVRVGLPTKATSIIKGIKRAKVELLLNREPNLYQDVSTFKRNCITDYLLDGNIFIYFDGAHLYHIPADKVQIHSDSKTYIEKYTYNDVDYSPNEIIHVKENSFYSTFRGVSRLKPAVRTMRIIKSMRDFQDNFFNNGAVPGLVLKSPNTLSEKIKERMIASWSQRYRPDAGGRRPLILDGGIEVDDLTNVNFKDLDFQNAILENEKVIAKALGIPYLLFDSGNNANIRPNMRMYYLETILPIHRKINYALERFFGFDIKEDTTEIPALQPELRDQSSYYSSLVNGGIITINEARERLGYDVMEGQDNIREPANIAGSATNPDEGGRPEQGDEESGE